MIELNFENTEKAFAYKKNKELKKARFLFNIMRFSPLVKIGANITPFLIKSGLPIRNIIKNTLFEQFVGGESLIKTAEVCDKLNQFRVQVILDYGIEGGEYDDAKYDQATDKFIEVISYASTRRNIPFISIKITGLISFSLLEKLNITVGLNNHQNIFSDFENAIKTLSSSELADWQKLISRMHHICKKANDLGIGVMIDAEESWIQDPIDFLAVMMMKEYNVQKAVVFNTVQLYRSDRYNFLMKSAEHAEINNYFLGLKLVRGAYMEKEMKRAKKLNYSNPIQENKKATDKDYNEAVSFCVSRIDKISTILASHNEKSNLLATKIINSKEISPNHPHLHFSQLYGMSDNLTFNLADAGFNVSKYLPFGPVEEVIPYLMRRAQENSSISGQTTRELDLINAECKRRGI